MHAKKKPGNGHGFALAPWQLRPLSSLDSGLRSNKLGTPTGVPLEGKGHQRRCKLLASNKRERTST
jgi:hypothetical protein